LRILLVDDDPAVLKLVARVLRKAELEVVEVSSGREALGELRATPFDVLVSDVHMPELTGLDLMRAVRAVDQDLPVILISGAPDVPTAAAAVEHGAFRYLTKPIDAVVLCDSVQRAARLRSDRNPAVPTGRRQLEISFQNALDSAWLAFQPIIEARSGRVCAVEALLRCDEPTLRSPPSVLAAATELGRLFEVGRRVRSLAAAAIENLPAPLSMFVNLHPYDLHDLDLGSNPAFARHARRIVLEVTERASLQISSDLASRLSYLRQLGFRVAVDDIGAGYSGLTSFAELMPEVVKIDMSLVRGCHENVIKQRTIGALAKLCRDVRCTVVAEGVETAEERDCVTQLGCELLQGYLLGRPVRELPKL
jgi:EAL domain-containing protein (putative c-di-GMP-specific phosphodiesterase class I)/CheY-like chemotaxis protein